MKLSLVASGVAIAATAGLAGADGLNEKVDVLRSIVTSGQERSLLIARDLQDPTAEALKCFEDFPNVLKWAEGAEDCFTSAGASAQTDSTN